MKKFIALAATFALILGIAITSFAAPKTKAKMLKANVTMLKKVEKPRRHHRHHKHRKFRHHRISMLKTRNH